MKVLSREEEEAHYNAVLKRGGAWGAAGLGGSMAGAMVLNRTWPAFRGLTLPLKAFAVSSVATFSLIVGADRGSRDYEHAVHEEAGLGMEEETLARQLGLEEKVRVRDLSTKGRVLEHVNGNKYSYVLGSWAASLVGSFTYISYSPLTTAQKVVQARMYAQGLTIAVLLASAGLAAAGATPAEVDERERKRENAMYRFKKGSPHEQNERQRNGQGHKDAETSE